MQGGIVSTKHLMLAWIKRNPTHGYAIKKRFGEFINPSESMNDAKLYPLLREMEEEGLITKELEEAESGPARKKIKITPKGAAVVEEWLQSDSGETLKRRPRYDFFRAFPFLTKFSFFYELDEKTISRKLDEQTKLHREKLDDFTAAKKKMVSKDLETVKIQTIDFGIMLEKTILKWLAEMSRYYGSAEKD